MWKLRDTLTRLARPVAGLAVAAFLAPGNVRSTTIDPLLWEELAITADFVGVVECTVAGGIVAHYRVVETLKGESKPGSTIAIRIPVDYWEPQYPLVLVGDRMLVAAYRNRIPSTMMSTTSGGPVPLWWRNIPYDYSLPLFQGAVRFLGTQPRRPDLVVSDEEAMAVREMMEKFLGLEADAKELALLKALATKYLDEHDEDEMRAPNPALDGVLEADTLAKALHALLEGWKTATEDSRAGYRGVLLKAGPGSRAHLRSLPARVFPSMRARADLLEYWGYIERADPPTIAEPKAPARPPNARTLKRWRDDLARSPDTEEHEAAMEGLIVHEPGPVAEWVAAWTNPDRHWSDSARGYVLGSWFGSTCGKDCTTHLHRLLTAKDPYVRAAAAVYLALYDEPAGLAALGEAAELPGDPGAWAALALARRGDRGALSRAIEVLADQRDSGMMDAVPHHNLQKRVFELLSNTAAAIGKPTPVYPGNPDALGKARAFLDANPQARPTDPWFATLKAQHID